MNGQTDIESALKQLQQAFAEKIPAKLALIRQQWRQLQASHEDRDIYQKLHRSVHTLNGTGATYGFTELARAAEAIERTLEQLPDKHEAWPDEAVSEIESLINNLEQPLSSAPGDQSQPRNIAARPGDERPHPLHSSAKSLIYLVDENPDSLNSLSMQIKSFGYDVKTYSELQAFEAAVGNEEPTAVIINTGFADNPKAGIEQIANINAAREQPLQTIFINGSQDILTRLEAARANAIAYFPIPVLAEQLVDTLDKLSHHDVEKAYRIMIVDDSTEQSAFAALTLKQAGMETMEVNDPLQVLSAFAEFPPDLILMDIYMPGCSGLELSRVIRQMDAYVSTPIVFLSTEHDLEKQLGAMSLGGDDFLSKPVQPWHLVSAVSSRVQRGRMIRKLAETDGLTGLLNHTRSKQRLETELARAKREKIPLCFAMLDIDHFKHINDSYGHPAGDRVLKSLANMFKQRLRPYDIIGRYGGEEFVVILPGTDPEQAMLIMDEMRIRFSEISHFSDVAPFSCTFSCGIAAFPDFDNGTALNDAADKALYQAKENGRNQIIVAGVEG